MLRIEVYGVIPPETLTVIVSTLKGRVAPGEGMEITHETEPLQFRLDDGSPQTGTNGVVVFCQNADITMSDLSEVYPNICFAWPDGMAVLNEQFGKVIIPT